DQGLDVTHRVAEAKTNEKGWARIVLCPGTYWVQSEGFSAKSAVWREVDLKAGHCESKPLGIDLGFYLTCTSCQNPARQTTCPDQYDQGDVVRIQTGAKYCSPTTIFELSTDVGTLRKTSDKEAHLETAKLRGLVRVTAVMRENPSVRIQTLLNVIEKALQSIG